MAQHLLAVEPLRPASAISLGDKVPCMRRCLGCRPPRGSVSTWRAPFPSIFFLPFPSPGSTPPCSPRSPAPPLLRFGSRARARAAASVGGASGVPRERPSALERASSHLHWRCHGWRRQTLDIRGPTLRVERDAGPAAPRPCKPERARGRPSPRDGPSQGPEGLWALAGRRGVSPRRRNGTRPHRREETPQSAHASGRKERVGGQGGVAKGRRRGAESGERRGKDGEERAAIAWIFVDHCSFVGVVGVRVFIRLCVCVNFPGR